MPEFRTEDLLAMLARRFAEQMVACGCNPHDPTEVDRFINGVAVSQKIKLLISEGMDDE